MLWSARFKKDLNKKVLDFTSSLELDKNFYKFDIKGSRVHVDSLHKIGIISADELEKILDGLDQIEKELDSDNFEFSENDEDIHMAIERRLTEIAGDVGKKLHTGRSRNDQVVLDTKLFLRSEIQNILIKIDALLQNLVLFAEKNKEVALPGYTHLQQAQPILFSHYILSYANKFCRDKKRFENVLEFLQVYPLGAGALAGTPYQVDRHLAAKELGFSQVSENSLDVVSDRDFVLDFLYAASVFAVNCSRLSEDFIIYSSQEFNFLEMDDAYTTGSSIMPQKKNPDIMELVRGKSQRIISSLNAFMNVLKALPMSYNRDLQEDKFYIFQALATTLEFLEILPDAIKTTKIKAQNMQLALDKGFLYATAIADYLVERGVPFREAYKITGQIVNYCVENNKMFNELRLDEFNNFFEKNKKLFDVKIYEILNAKNIINNQKIYGGTSLSSVEKQIENFKMKSKGSRNQ